MSASWWHNMKDIRILWYFSLDQSGRLTNWSNNQPFCATSMSKNIFPLIYFRSFQLWTIVQVNKRTLVIICCQKPAFPLFHLFVLAYLFEILFLTSPSSVLRLSYDVQYLWQATCRMEDFLSMSWVCDPNVSEILVLHHVTSLHMQKRKRHKYK